MIRTGWALALVSSLLVAAFLAGWSARAEAGERAPRRHLVCELFEVDVEEGARLETADQTKAPGQWIATHEAAGWEVASVDFELGQTATGRVRAWRQVCLERAL